MLQYIPVIASYTYQVRYFKIHEEIPRLFLFNSQLRLFQNRKQYKTIHIQVYIV